MTNRLPPSVDQRSQATGVMEKTLFNPDGSLKRGTFLTDYSSQVVPEWRPQFDAVQQKLKEASDAHGANDDSKHLVIESKALARRTVYELIATDAEFCDALVAAAHASRTAVATPATPAAPSLEEKLAVAAEQGLNIDPNFKFKGDGETIAPQRTGPKAVVYGAASPDHNGKPAVHERREGWTMEALRERAAKAAGTGQHEL